MPSRTDNFTAVSREFIAAVLVQAYGDASMLCYGLADDSELLPTMQQQLLDDLARAVNSTCQPPAAVLLSGPSLGSLSESVAKAGFKCHWLNRLAINNKPESENFKTSLDDFGRFDPGQLFDCIVLEGTIHYQDQLRYLQQARALLPEGGVLIVVGEYLRDDTNIAFSPLANLSSWCHLSQRLGLYVESEQELSRGASASLTLLLSHAVQYETALTATLGGAASYQSGLRALQRIQKEFDTGYRCLRLYGLRKKSHTEGEYVNAEYADIDSFAPQEVAELFEASFQEPFDAAVWHWKYACNNGRSVVAREHKGGPIVSHYGGAPRQIEYFGNSATAIQVCDVMVLPEQRRYYGKSSLFFKTAATFLEREIGNTARHLLGFGFPNQKAMNIATRLGLYDKTDDFVEIVFAAPSEIPAQGDLLPFVIDRAEHEVCLDQLWQAMRVDFVQGIIGLRDREYFQYRYLNHPRSADYDCRLVHDGRGEALAVAVLKIHESQQLLMDLICPLANMEAALQILSHALAEEEGAMTLKFWITRAWLDRLPTTQAIVNELGIEIPCNSWNPGPDARTLYGAWWLTAGDMDFT